MKRIGALAFRIFRQFLRDRRTLVLIFAVPVFIMILLTWVLKAEAQPFRVAVYAASEESSMVKNLLRDLLIKNANVEMVEGIERAEVMDALRDGRIQGAIVLSGAGITDLQSGKRAGIEVVADFGNIYNEPDEEPDYRPFSRT